MRKVLSERKSIENLDNLYSAMKVFQDYKLEFTAEAAFVAVLSDAVECKTYDQLGSLHFDKLLELRIFDKTKELLVWRDYQGEPFTCRILDDSVSLDKLTPFVETHYLDQDTSIGKTVENSDGATTFHAMGGGKYTLPVAAGTNGVRVCTYLKANPENGIEYPVDWRIIEFIKIN